MNSNVQASQENNERGKECEKTWVAMNGKHRQSPDILLEKWLNLEKQCKGTGIYESRLASTYIRLGQVSRAKNIIKDALSNKLDYYHYLKASELAIQLSELAYGKIDDKKRYEELIDEFGKLTAAYPDWVHAYELQSNIELFIGKRDDAIKHATKAILLDSDSWGGYRILVIAYTERGEFNDARPLISKAINLNDDLLNDSEFMYASAWTYTAKGEFKTAEAALSRLVEGNPKVKDDPKFLKVLRFLKQEMLQ